ncbi:phytoene desaturase family protein [Aquimarina sp. ERC-38]|uniref:1-hydroxycarotenoid 3,4-desaturase CrtD n=1 Tax=Aquimarina sp. ERC-38 TaxID=2949996 RepID=UPI0022486EC2|nr:1-hydroxycarotenoid 3,4-desaturase CrtD [Aquimarina sp. ERC-38]UZO81903.1 phytoene desaturase family protein [Aquimarina sp. ERC-38]
MESKKAIIIGAGIAGIATAIRLQKQGFEVTVFEANTYPGGKLSQMNREGYRFDCGPSLFTMPQFVEELFTLVGRDIKKYFEYEKKEVVCNYFFEDQTRFTAYADKEAYATEAAKVFNIDKKDLLAYFKKSKQKYDLTSSLFLEKSLHKLQTYLSKDTIKAITRLNSLDIDKNLNEVNEGAFKDPKLVQLFNRYATYNGSSPYQTPGIMSMIPHLEQHFGTFFPKGGMYSITQSLFQLAKDIGINFQFSTLVSDILVSNHKAVGVKIENTVYHADLVVSNMDIVPTYKKLLADQPAPEKTLAQPRSSSALIFYWGIRKEFKELDLHNIFFSKYYKEEFDAIFNQKTISNDPTVYINITSKNEIEDAPTGCENWFVMINVPGNTGQNWDELINTTRKNCLRKINRMLQTDIEPLIATEEILDPRSIESKTQSYQGSLYGSSSNNKFAAFLRHPNFSQKIKNLFFCGGSVHPGGGIPLCLLSGKIVSDLVNR